MIWNLRCLGNYSRYTIKNCISWSRDLKSLRSVKISILTIFSWEKMYIDIFSFEKKCIPESLLIISKIYDFHHPPLAFCPGVDPWPRGRALFEPGWALHLCWGRLILGPFWPLFVAFGWLAGRLWLLEWGPRDLSWFPGYFTLFSGYSTLLISFQASSWHFWLSSSKTPNLPSFFTIFSLLLAQILLLKSVLDRSWPLRTIHFTP